MAQGSNASNNNNNPHNMVPIISVTPHSPGTKYNNILGKYHFKSASELIQFTHRCSNLFLFFLALLNAEDTLNQLQSIRESVVKIKNAPNRSPQFISSNLISLVILHLNFASAIDSLLINSFPLQSTSSRMFSSCPSLPDLTAANLNNIWPNSQHSGLNSDRRKSWTAIEDLTECSKNSHKR